jgi:hypothetical protein
MKGRSSGGSPWRSEREGQIRPSFSLERRRRVVLLIAWIGCGWQGCEDADNEAN